MKHINEEVGYYHPRTAEQSGAFSGIIVRELVNMNGTLATHLRDGTVAYDFDVNVSDGVSEHTTDLVIGSPSSKPLGIRIGVPIRARINTSDYRVLIDHKSVVTAHRNRLNRLRDFKELASHANAYNRKAIVGGTLLLGTSRRYLSVETVGRVLSARGQRDRTDYWRKRMLKNDKELVAEFESTDAMTENSEVDPGNTFNVFMKELPMRRSDQEKGFDAFAVIPVLIDNIGPCRLDEASFPHNEKSYTKFMDDIVRCYDARF